MKVKLIILDQILVSALIGTLVSVIRISLKSILQNTLFMYDL